MVTDNPAFLLSGALQTSFGQRSIPEPGPNEVVIEVKKTGICGSDLHWYFDGKMVDNVVTEPFVLGHESAGIVSKAGSQVKKLRVGDRVAMEPGPTCRKCEDCKSGRYQLCAHCQFAADHPQDGTLQRYYKLPSDFVYRLPDYLSLEDGALIEPLSCAIHAVFYAAQVRAGQNVVVFGCGPIGLLCMAVAKAAGAARIVAVDINPRRLEFAQSYVATDAFTPPSNETGESNMSLSERAAALMKEQLGIGAMRPTGIDVVMDATGAEPCIQMSLLIVKPGGKYVQVGFGPNEVKIPITALLVKEITVTGSFRYGPGDYQLAIALASAGRVDLKPLVTHRYGFTEAVDAFEATSAGMGLDGQVVIKTVISGPGVDTSRM